MIMKSERRKYPRIDVGGDVSLLVAGVIRTGTLTNLSPSGIQIECRHQLIEQLSRFKSGSGLYPDFELEFRLADDEPIQCSCTVSYLRRLSQDTYHLGLEFVALSDNDEQRVDATIHHAVAA